MQKNTKIRHIYTIIFFVSLFITILNYYTLQADEDNNDVSLPDTLLTNTSTHTTVWDSLFYQADTLYYYVDKEKILLSGNAKVIYHSATIQAENISIDFLTNQALAFGYVILEDGDQLILGKEVYFDIETETGMVIDGASRFDQGYYYGDEIRKIGETVYDLDKGIYTTCDALHPHFSIGAWSMRLYHNDALVGRPIVFYVNELPVLAFPFAAISVKSGRASGFLMPSPGYTQGDGKYLKELGYFYVINDYSDVTLSMDFLQKQGQTFRVNYIYLDRYRYNGGVNAIYRYRKSEPDRHANNWHVSYNHFQKLPDKATFSVDLKFESGREVWDNDLDVNNRLKNETRSSISYRRPLASSHFTTSALYVETYTFDEIKEETVRHITLPRFQYSLPSRPVHELIPFIPDDVRRQNHWWKSFSMGWSIMGTHEGTITNPNPSIEEVLWKNAKDEDDKYISEHHAGLRQTINLSHNTTAFGWLRFSNSISYQDALFDRDKNGNLLAHGYSYSYNNSLSFNMYGTGVYRRGPVTAARHIITPRVGFNYSPDFSKNDRFYSFGGVNVSQSRKTMRMNFDLDNRWQFRLKPDKNNQEKRLNDLIVFRSSTGYNFEATTKPWSDLNHSLTINPGSYETFGVKYGITQSLSTTQKVYENFDFSSYRANTSLQLSGDALYLDYFPVTTNDFVNNHLFKPDTLSITEEQILTIKDLERLESPGSWSVRSNFDYTYNRSNKRKTQYIDNAINLRVTQNWSISYRNKYDITNSNMMSQTFDIVRDLHCWKIDFTYTQNAGFWDIRVMLFNTTLNELRVRHSTGTR